MRNFTLHSSRNQTNRPSFAHAHLTILGGRLTLLVLSTAMVLVAAEIGKSGPVASHEAEVREALARYTEAIESMDLHRIMDCYADRPDVSVFSPSARKAIVGKAMIRKDWADFINIILKKSVPAEPSDLSITTFGDTAIVHYTKIEELFLKNGKTPTPFMRITLVFWKIGGKWLIEHENYSLPAGN